MPFLPICFFKWVQWCWSTEINSQIAFSQNCKAFFAARTICEETIICPKNQTLAILKSQEKPSKSHFNSPICVVRRKHTPHLCPRIASTSKLKYQLSSPPPVIKCSTSEGLEWKHWRLKQLCKEQWQPTAVQAALAPPNKRNHRSIGILMGAHFVWS